MSYSTGVVNSMADLLTAVQTALTAAGWSNDGAVYYKTPSGGVELAVKLSSDTLGLYFRVGNGHAAGDLTTPAPGSNLICTPASLHPFTYPATYFIHVSDSEVFIVFKYSVNYYVTGGFGQSGITGGGGSGNWSSGVAYTSTASSSMAGSNFSCVGNSYSAGNNNPRMGIFNLIGGDGNSPMAYFHANSRWYPDTASSSSGNSVKTLMTGALAAIENPLTNYNGQATLFPVMPVVLDGNYKILGDLKKIRMINIDNLLEEDIVTLGADKWKVYPHFRKNSAERGGGEGHSGSKGWAIYYDGP